MNRNYKLVLGCLLALGLSQTVSAYPGSGASFYVGAQVGGANLHYDHSKFAEDATSISDKGFAGRISAGFNINQSLALEAGYTLYQDPEFRFGRDVKSNFSQDSADLLAKVSLPVSCNVSVYAKGGMAYVFRDDAQVTNDNITFKLDQDDKHIRPLLGVGVSYAFNCRVSGDLGVFRTFGTEDLEDTDFYGAGITVKLG
jgi:OOP family OmpA-OmpF porin